MPQEQRFNKRCSLINVRPALECVAKRVIGHKVSSKEIACEDNPLQLRYLSIEKRNLSDVLRDHDDESPCYIILLKILQLFGIRAFGYFRARPVPIIF